MHVAPTERFLQLKPGLLSLDQEFESLFDPLDASPHPLNDNHLCTALADPVHNLLAESLPTEGTLELHHYLHYPPTCSKLPPNYFSINDQQREIQRLWIMRLFDGLNQRID